MRGTHRESSGYSPIVVVLGIAVAAIVGITLFLVFRGNGLPDLLPGIGDDRDEVPAFSFRVAEVEAFHVAKPPRKATLARARTQLHRLMDRLYVAGFVDPALWEEGAFTATLQPFAGQAAQRARRDLPDLTLGPAAAALERVLPTLGNLRLTVLFDGRRRPVAAVALARFRGTGTLRDGGEIPVSHQGRYVLRVLRGRWAIVAYQVRGRIGEAARAGGSPQPTGTAP